MIIYTALDMISTGKVAFDKAELSSTQLGHSIIEASEVNPESISWGSKAEVLNIRLLHKICPEVQEPW